MATIASLLAEHVSLEVRSVDRIFVAGYVPRLQSEGLLVRFLLDRGFVIPSPAGLGRIGAAYVRAVDRFAQRNGLPVVHFGKVLHPVVRPDEDEVERLRERFNRALRRDGWELVEVDQLSGRPIYAGRRVQGHRTAASALSLDRYDRVLDEEVIREHLRRIDSGLERDPAAAIASSKELVESTCKVILNDYDVQYSRRDDVMDLFKKTTTALKLRAEDIPEGKRGSDAAKKTLRAMVPLVQGLAELRNELGLGHGRDKRSNVPVRYARLAFNATVTVVEFLLDTWHVRKDDRGAA